MASLSRRLSFSVIILVFLAWPVLAMAQAAPEPGASDFVGPPTAEEAAAKESEQKRQNSAEAINVKLQVPLPFVPMTCKDTEGNPAVCKLTDYIAGMYRLLVGLGALFAVVMFIIAGYQWIFAGGSADKIGAAKKRIMGAVMGLILALLSYVILNSISARLVELRLPLVDPVPGIEFLGGNYCQDSESLKGLEKKQGKLELILAKPPAAASSAGAGEDTVALADAKCGNEYTIKGTESLGACWGKNCVSPPDTVCVQNKCLSIVIYGSINWAEGSPPPGGALRQLVLGANDYVDQVNVVAVCGDNSTKEAAEGPAGKWKRYYDISTWQFAQELKSTAATVWDEILITAGIQTRGEQIVSDVVAFTQVSKQDMFKKIEGICGGQLKGFALEVEVNDDQGWLYNVLPTNDDGFMLGRDCNVPLYKKAGGEKQYKRSQIDWATITKEQLWQPTDFMSGAECNIHINRDYFPAR